ncbi:MAG: MerR family transcriptional regulator [Chloroflexota bacterium]
MFKIGDFAKLAQVSTYRLRNYDKQGLLHPVQIDHFTGYRYYSAEQLGRLNRIIALRELGLTLAQVKHALITQITPEQLEQMLLNRQAQIKHEISQKEEQLLQVRDRLKQIKEESHGPSFEIVVKPLPAYPVASLRMVVKHAHEVHESCNALHSEIHQSLKNFHIKTVSPALNLYHMEYYRETDIDIEACVVVTPEAMKKESDSKIQFRWLQEVPQAATMLFSEDCTHASLAFMSLAQWAARAGYRVAGPTREVHHSPLVNMMMTQTGQPIVEFQLPIGN